MSQRIRFAVAVPLVLVLSASRCSGEVAVLDDLGKSLANANRVDEGLINQANKARSLTGLDSELVQQRRNLFVRLDTLSLKGAYLAADQAAQGASSVLEDAGSKAVGYITLQNPNSSFRAALAKVTKDTMKEKACALILDAVAPEAKDPNDPGEAATWTDAVQQAIDKLAKEFRPPPDGWDQAVAWTGWAQQVAQSAQQVHDSIIAGTTDVTFFARPPVARATVAYARFCYAIPKQV